MFLSRGTPILDVVTYFPNLPKNCGFQMTSRGTPILDVVTYFPNLPKNCGFQMTSRGTPICNPWFDPNYF